MRTSLRWGVRKPPHTPAPAFGRYSSRSRRGAAAAETAMVLPVFFLLILGMIEFSRALSVSQLMTASTRSACRRAIIAGATSDEIVRDTRTYLSTMAGIAEESISVDVSITPNRAGNKIEKAQPGDIVAIKVDVPHTAVQYFAGRYLRTASLTSSCAMVHE